MFDIGFSELVVIALVALLVFGPKRLPEMARTAGFWMGRIRRFMDNVKQDLDREMNSGELAEFKKLQEELAATRELVQRQGGQTLEMITRDAHGEGQDASAAPSDTTPALPDPARAANASERSAGAPKKRAAKKRAVKKRAAPAKTTTAKDHGENP